MLLNVRDRVAISSTVGIVRLQNRNMTDDWKTYIGAEMTLSSASSIFSESLDSENTQALKHNHHIRVGEGRGRSRTLRSDVPKRC